MTTTPDPVSEVMALADGYAGLFAQQIIDEAGWKRTNGARNALESRVRELLAATAPRRGAYVGGDAPFMTIEPDGSQVYSVNPVPGVIYDDVTPRREDREP